MIRHNFYCLLLLASIGFAQNIVGNPTGSQTINQPDQPSNTTLSVNSLNNIIYLGVGPYPCSADGMNSAISDIVRATPTGGQVDTSGCTGTPPIDRNISIKTGIVVRLHGPAIWQASSCPAFTLTGEGAWLDGAGMGNPRAANTTGAIQAVTGCAGPIVRLNVNAGVRGAHISNLKIDCNSIGTVTAGIEDSVNQDEEHTLENISIGQSTTATPCNDGIIFLGNNQSFRAHNLSIHYVNVGIDASGPNLRDILIEGSRIEAFQQGAIVGAHDNNPSNRAENVRLVDVNFDMVSSSATAVVQLYNTRHFQARGGWWESDTPMTGNAQLVIGDSTSQSFGASILGVEFIGNDYIPYHIDLRNSEIPNVVGNGFFGATTKAIKNTNTLGGTIWANYPGGVGSIVDSYANLTAVEGNTTLVNDLPNFPMGISVSSGTGLTGQTGSGTRIVTDTSPRIVSPVINSGISNSGSGLMHVRVSSCTTPAAVNGSCTTTISWPATWADTNYTYSCFPDGTTGTGLSVTNGTNKSTTQVTVGVVNCCGSSTASSTVLNCIGIHD